MGIVTVTTPAASRAITLLATVKAELQITSSTDDAVLQTHIDQVSRAIESYLGRTLARETVTETFRQDKGQQSLLLARWPVAIITSVVEGSTTLVSGTDFELDTDSGQLFRLSGDYRSYWATGKIVINYSAGYKLPADAQRDLPYDLERAAIDLVKVKYYARARDPHLRSESILDVYSASYSAAGSSPDGMPPEICALLDPYRSVSV